MPLFYYPAQTVDFTNFKTERSPQASPSWIFMQGYLQSVLATISLRIKSVINLLTKNLVYIYLCGFESRNTNSSIFFFPTVKNIFFFAVTALNINHYIDVPGNN